MRSGAIHCCCWAWRTVARRKVRHLLGAARDGGDCGCADVRRSVRARSVRRSRLMRVLVAAAARVAVELRPVHARRRLDAPPRVDVARAVDVAPRGDVARAVEVARD